MNSFEKLMKAKTALGLHDKASLSDIKNSYKSLMKKWHPDNNSDDLQRATKMSMQINDAYEIMLQYCNSFEYPLDEKSLKQASLSPQEWLAEKFGTKRTTI